MAEPARREEMTTAGTGPQDDGPQDGGPDEAVAGLGFDAALAEFQRVVTELEGGGQPLEEALALYERGVVLQAHLDRLLGEAELRIQRLVERAGGRLEAVDLEADAPEA